VAKLRKAVSDLVKTIYLSIHLGLDARNLLRLGTLDQLLADASIRVILVTRAHHDPDFKREFTSERVVVAEQQTFNPSRFQSDLIKFRQRRIRRRRFLETWLRFERRFFPRHGYDRLFEQYLPSVVVSADPMRSADIPLILGAQQWGAPTLGVVRSWDNIVKRLAVHPDKLAVWNPVNRDEAIALELYRPEDVFLVGAPQFDPYFSPEGIVPRAEFLTSLGLDPGKKTILVATSVSMYAGDETFLLDTLLRAAAQGRLAEPVNLVCRPHPYDLWGPYVRYQQSGEIYFDVTASWNRVLLSMMTRDDVLHMANLLRHTDVMINFATTVTLEAAIFDVPTILVAYGEGDQAQTQEWVEKWHFEKHFRGIVERNLAPVVRNETELVDWINRYLIDRTLYQQERQEIVKQWVYFTDGKSGERIAQLIQKMADGTVD